MKFRYLYKWLPLLSLPCCGWGNSPLALYDTTDAGVSIRALVRTESRGDSCPEYIALRLTAHSARPQGIAHLRVALRWQQDGVLRPLMADNTGCSFGSFHLEEVENRTRLVWESTRPFPLLPADTALLLQLRWETPAQGCLTFETWEEVRLTCADAGGTCPLDTQVLAATACIQQRLLEISAYYAADGSPLTHWEYHLTPCESRNHPNCERRGYSGEHSALHVCACSLSGEEQGVRLSKQDALLRGISTADVIAIVHHIQGIRPIEDGLHLLAADMDNNGTVTMSDALTLYRMLLGNPHREWSEPWRFWPQMLAEAARATPTAWEVLQPDVGTPCGEPSSGQLNRNAEISRFHLPFASDSAARLTFIGFKVGDVNADVLSPPSGGPPITWGTYARMGNAGNRAEIPVFATESQALAGWQMTLHYDTTLLHLSEMRWTSVRRDNGDHCDWHSPTPGEIRLLCLSGNQPYLLQAGQPIFFIAGQWKRSVRQPIVPIQIRLEGDLPSEAYDTLLTPRPCRIATSNQPLLYPDPDPQHAVECRLAVEPNPNRGAFRLHIEVSAPVRGYLRLYDAYQQIIYETEMRLPAGLTAIPSARFGPLPPGRYRVSLATSEAHYSLSFVRQ